MRRSASLALLFLLSGCGYATWWNPPFTGGYNPHAPVGDAENMLRVEGHQPAVPPLTPEPGDIWPGPVPPEPTLQELEQQGNMGTAPQQPVPGSPLSRGALPGENPPSPPPQVTRGSSTPPASNQPGLAPLPNMSPASPPNARAAASPERGQAGRVITTPGGPGVTTGGTQGYQTMTLPGGGSAIVVPNGNGTSTVIKPDGTMDTITTPR